MIDEDENDFRFVIVKAVDFEILCEIVSAVDHASIVPKVSQDCNPPFGGVDELWISESGRILGEVGDLRGHHGNLRVP